MQRLDYKAALDIIRDPYFRQSHYDLGPRFWETFGDTRLIPLDAVYVKMNQGLVIFEPMPNKTLWVTSLLYPGDVRKNMISTMQKNLAEFKSLGFERLITKIRPDNYHSRYMAAAFGAKITERDREYLTYELNLTEA